MARRDDRILDPSFVSDLVSISIEDLRVRRAECEESEAELSYFRRLLQGKLDILKHEVERRVGGGDPGMEALISNLAFILADGPGSGSRGQHQDVSSPTNSKLQRREVERLVSEAALSSIDDISPLALTEIIERLTEAETKTSDNRRRIQNILDKLLAELVRRYRDGSENIEELLAN